MPHIPATEHAQKVPLEYTVKSYKYLIANTQLFPFICLLHKA